METNPQLETARRYVEQTGVSLFLTGKAGTGKTTFLHDIVATTAKRHVVLAPTGVAAVNAGGVTIHSFFQLPFDPYLPDVKELVTEYQMPENRKSLSKNKLNIIRTLELLIIDEISMVRADLLDAIDMTLRRYRRSSRPFGGVQLLMIGDVHQLSPVVTETERPFMEKVYPSPYFFASKALQQMSYVTIELTTVYRQQDATFVDLLNHVRDNRLDAETLRALNARVEKGKREKGSEQAITLTTHNRQADAINNRHMAALTGERRVYEAILKGNYPEKSLPCDQSLEVKVGERVMFVKNDSSGTHRYYNGMLATVTGFIYDSENDKEYIEVIGDDGDVINVNRELWECMKYKLDEKTNEITQEVDGTFCQYPLQAAWAVTIHKAQGLTFDHVAIDAADAFAFGQVYVALSRCRTLEGLTLTTPLTPGVTFNDASVSHFVSAQPTFEQTAAATEEYERQYRLEKLLELYGMDDIMHLTERLQEHYGKLKNIYPENVERLHNACNAIVDLQGVGEKFKTQLMRLDETGQNERAQKGADYYLSQLTPFLAVVKVLLDIEIDNKETAKHVDEAGQQLTEALNIKIACLEAVKKQGFSVQAVQHAKLNFLIEKDDNKKGHERSAKPAKKRGKDGIDNELFTALRNWRAMKAEDQGVPVYVILQQKALHAIATNTPQTIAELKQQIGVGEKTVERYGDEIIDIVKDYANNNI